MDEILGKRMKMDNAENITQEESTNILYYGLTRTCQGMKFLYYALTSSCQGVKLLQHDSTSSCQEVKLL